MHTTQTIRLVIFIMIWGSTQNWLEQVVNQRSWFDALRVAIRELVSGVPDQEAEGCKATLTLQHGGFVIGSLNRQYIVTVLRQNQPALSRAKHCFQEEHITKSLLARIVLMWLSPSTKTYYRVTFAPSLFCHYTPPRLWLLNLVTKNYTIETNYLHKYKFSYHCNQ